MKGRLLVRALNATLGLDLADSAEARAWLADGGWERLEAWLAAHRDDTETTAGLQGGAASTDTKKDDFMTAIQIQDLSTPDAPGYFGPEVIVSTDVKVQAVNMGDTDAAQDSDDFVNVALKWNDDRETELSIDAGDVDKFVSELVRARLELRDKRATIRLADLTGVRIDAGAEVISVDGLSGACAGGPGADAWRLDDRRNHVYGDFTCEGTADCAGCGTRPLA